MQIVKSYTCVECGTPLADFLPCTGCGNTRIEEQSARGVKILDYRAELARAVRMSGLPEQEIAAFEISQTRRGRTRCVIWQLVGEQIEKFYFYGRQPKEGNHG